MRMQQNSRPGSKPIRKIEAWPSASTAISFVLPRSGEFGNTTAAARIAAHAESLGYATVWLLEKPASNGLETYNLMNYLAARTSSLHIGGRLDFGDLPRAASLAAKAAERFTFAVNGPIENIDRSVLLDWPSALVQLVGPGSSAGTEATVVANCQVTYQDLGCRRSPFAGTFAQIARDFEALRSQGASEVIFDFTHSASLTTVDNFLMHLERCLEAIQPGTVARPLADDRFDWIV